MAEPGVDLKRQWYKALFAEDCVQVKKLLTENGRLLNEGWKEDTQASMQFKLERSWKGRTALHVAVRRGDVELVQLILNLCPMLDDGGGNKGVEGSASSNFLELVDGHYELDALAMAVINGNEDIVNLLTMSSQPNSPSPPLNNNYEAPGGSTPYQHAAPYKHRENEGALVQEIAAPHKHRENEGALVQEIARRLLDIHSKSTSRFSNRLELGDSDYEPDVLATAVIDFLTGSIRPNPPLTPCESNQGGSTPHQPAPREHGKNQAALLKTITVEVLEETAESLAKAVVELLPKSRQSDSSSTGSYISHGTEDRGSALHELDAHEHGERGVVLLRNTTDRVLDCLKKIYEENCDFNFLDMNLYFFHYTFSTGRTENREALIKPIQSSIFSRARASNLLEYLLFELWDGQGQDATTCCGGLPTGRQICWHYSPSR